MLSNTRQGAQTTAAFLALAVYSILHQLPFFPRFFLKKNTYDDGFVGSSKPLISIIVIIVINTDPLGRFQIANNTSEKGGLPNQG